MRLKLEELKSNHCMPNQNEKWVALVQTCESYHTSMSLNFSALSHIITNITIILTLNYIL